MTSLKAIMHKMQTEMTPLVGYGLVFMLLALGGLTLDRFNAYQQKEVIKLASLQTEVANLRSLKGMDMWSERLEQSNLLLNDLEFQLWDGGTYGVIAADFQQSMQGLARRYNVENFNLSVDPKAESLNDVETLSFSFSARLASGHDVVDWLSKTASSPQTILLQEISITNSLRDRRQSYMTGSGIIPVNIISAPSGEVQ